MARPSKDPPMPSPLVPALLRLVQARDASDATLLALRLGLSEDVIGLDEVPVTEAMVASALEGAADAFSEPHLALRLPADLPLRRYGLAELTARSTPTLRDAFRRMSRYASLIHPAITCTLDESEGEARWTQQTPNHPRGLGRHVHEYALAHVLTCARRDTGAPIATARVWFAHPRPPDIAPVLRFFETREVAFGCEDSGFALTASALDLPMGSGDARLLATAEDLAEAALRAQPRMSSLSSRVAAQVEALLPGGASMGAVAESMHMSARTLQRRLDDEGDSFSEIVDHVREKLARRWLGDEGRTLAEVGFTLGFSDLATFSRGVQEVDGEASRGVEAGVGRKRAAAAAAATANAVAASVSRAEGGSG